VTAVPQCAGTSQADLELSQRAVSTEGGAACPAGDLLSPQLCVLLPSRSAFIADLGLAVMQLLLACHQLEDLTLCGCTTHPRTGRAIPRVHPFLGATAEFLDAVARSATHSAGLRSIQLHCDKSQQHAYLDTGVLSDLAAVPNMVVNAASVVLCVPLPCATVPAALKIVTQRLVLTGCRSVDELENDVAALRARCQLVIEGACLKAAVAEWTAPPQHDSCHHLAYQYWRRGLSTEDLMRIANANRASHTAH